MRGQKVLKDRCGGITITQALVEQELSFISAVYRQNVLQKEMFVAELAGVPIGIISRFESTKEFFLDYLTDQLPMTIVSVSDEEMMMEDDEISERTEQMVINSKIASALADYNAFLMRTAVISVDGQGVGFAAPNGVGKTTRALLWKKALGDRVRVVNGSKPVFGLRDDGVYAFGSPWRGRERLGSRESVPMKAMCFIERGDEVSLKRMTPDDAAMRLMQQVMIPKETKQMCLLISLLEKFVQTVPFYLYTCNMEKEKPEMLWEEMKRR